MRKQSLTPSPSSQKKRHNHRFMNENIDPNVMHSKPSATKLKSPLPPRPLKRKLSTEMVNDNGALVSDSGVQVIVRMRPLNKELEECEQIVQKISCNTVSILDHRFTFDSVVDSTSTQNDMYEFIGVPLVENCLEGFNSSIFAYGQTGSGKTYTMWGPPNALSVEGSLNEDRGLAPRVFERLFCRIKEEEAKHSEKQLTYQCHCSFLEIYNEQITDLLDPTQGNLQIREDVKTGIYVDCLTEENVVNVKDVIKILKKGLANRKTGSTSMNAESSRSHSVFTCVVESRSKSTADGLNHLKISKMNLIDLAGSEKQKLTGAAGERLKEAGNINRSLSQLGNLINILAEVSQSGKTRHIPYRDSKLTFLLQESLGGNAKLAMICAISPSQSCKSETFSTLRFAQRAKVIKNKAVINEVVQDDVNVLRTQISELKNQILRMKSAGKTPENSGANSTRWIARRSINLLKSSLALNYPKVLPVIEDDSDVEMEIDEEDEKLSKNEENEISADKRTVDAEVTLCGNEAGEPVINALDDKTDNLLVEKMSDENMSRSMLPSQSNSPCYHNSSRKSLKTSSSISASQAAKLSTSFSGNLNNSGLIEHLQKSKTFHLPSEQVESDLHQIHNQVSSLRESDLSLPTKSFDFNPLLRDVKNVGVQTLTKETEIYGDPLINMCSYCMNKIQSKISEVDHETELHPADETKPEDKNVGIQTLTKETDIYGDSSINMCSYCMNKTQSKISEVDHESELHPAGETKPEDKTKILIPKKVEKVLAGAFRREMELENYCTQQAAEIAELNQLIQQFKQERECNAEIQKVLEAKISHLESLIDGILPPEEFIEKEYLSLKKENKYLKEKLENHPEILRLDIELKRVQDELEGYRSFFDLGERDVLVEEILDLKSQLQYYIDSSSMVTQDKIPQQLTQPTELAKATNTEKLEEENRQWTETESRWASICEDLKHELEINRSLAEKRQFELDSEKRCVEELKEALEVAMQGHAGILERYADLEERYIELHGRHRQMINGIEDVKKAAAKAGVKGMESKFIKALAAEISNLKTDRENERRLWSNERKRLQAQNKDTAEAVKTAAELVERMKEAENTAACAQKRALKAELEAKKAYKEIDNLKINHEKQIAMLNQLLAESRLPKEAIKPVPGNTISSSDKGGGSLTDPQWGEELGNFGKVDAVFAGGTESWYTDYDRCNM